VIFRVVSRGSCARAAELMAQSVNSAPTTSVKIGALCSVECAELVVCVSLTQERTVYFTL
jgi:hypothetical protein